MSHTNNISQAGMIKFKHKSKTSSNILTPDNLRWFIVPLHSTTTARICKKSVLLFSSEIR